MAAALAVQCAPMIILRDIAIRRGSKLLLSEASVTLQPGQHLALIGANGCGKSSVFAMLLGELGADTGSIEGLQGLRIAHMAQEVHAADETAADYVLGGDAAVAALIHRSRKAEASGDFEAAAAAHQALDAANGYDAPRRALALLRGLGFEEDAGERAVTSFSGGWRIRLNLARALMTPSELLLLDEPTNHLDLDATLWLQDWLGRYEGTLLLISHDRDFIDATCQRVLHIEGQRLNAYKGNYSDFERDRAQRLANEQASFEKQQRRAAEIEDFVRRFRYKATKAKQAQSRLKELERMQIAAPAHFDSPFEFRFLAPERASDPILRLDEADLGYTDRSVLTQVDLQIRPGDRLGLLGRNGAGKSTLLKSLSGKLALLSGQRQPGTHCAIGYFDQQQLDVLDLDASPLLHLQRLSPDARQQEMLDFLGGFDFRGDAATTAIRPFSGGEKARLALAMVVWQRPNLLVLDEPTNHLDLDMRHALEVALQGFEGALLLVSHDRHLLRNTVETLALVHDGRVTEWSDDLAAYERWTLSREVSDAAAPSTADERDSSKKSQRQQAAAQRERLRPLQKAVKATESAMAKTEKALAEVQQLLADNALYDVSRKTELAELLQREGELKSESDSLEEQWLEQQEALELALSQG